MLLLNFNTINILSSYKNIIYTTTYNLEQERVYIYLLLIILL